MCYTLPNIDIIRLVLSIGSSHHLLVPNLNGYKGLIWFVAVFVFSSVDHFWINVVTRTSHVLYASCDRFRYCMMTSQKELDVSHSRAEKENLVAILTTALKSFALAAGLHIGVNALAGVTSQRLFKRLAVSMGDY